jgi:hypothetical protein
MQNETIVSWQSHHLRQPDLQVMTCTSIVERRSGCLSVIPWHLGVFVETKA